MLSSHPDAQKWNARYREEGAHWLTRRPRPLLIDWLPLLPANGLALDAAAGVAIHGRCLARHGLHAIALDIAEVGLRLAQQAARADGLWLETAVVDLSRLWLPPHTFDVIVNYRFLERATFPAYQRALKPGGWLLFETFVRTDPDAPDPDYYLQPGELRAAFADWDIHHSAQIESGNGRVTDQLVARKPAAPSP